MRILNDKILLVSFLISLLSIEWSCKNNKEESQLNNKVQNIKLSIERLKSKDDYSAILVLADSLELIARRHGSDDLLKLAYSEKSNSHARLHHLREALFYNFFIISNFRDRQNRYSEYICKSYLNLSYLFKFWGKDLISYNYINKAIEESQNQNNPGLQAEIYNEAGLILYQQKNYKQAQNQFAIALQKSKIIKNQTKIKFLEQQLYSNIGLCLDKLKQYDIAIKYFDSAYTIASTLKPEVKEAVSFPLIAKAVIYGNKGNVYLHKGETKKGIELLKESIKINSNPGYAISHAIYTQLELIDYYLKSDSLKAAEKLLFGASKALFLKANSEQITDYNKLAAQWYLKQGEFKKASGYLDNYIIKKDSLENSRKALDFSHLILGKKVLELDARLSNVKSEYAIEEGKTKKYTFLFSLSIFILIVVSYFLYNYRKITKKLKLLNIRISNSNNKMELINQKQKELIKEKNQILGVVAHDLNSPVAGIQGLTEILKENLEQFPGEKIDENKKIFSYIETSILHMKEVISDLIEMASLEKEKGIILKNEVSLSFILDKIVSIHQSIIKRKHIEIQLEILPKELKIMANVEKLSRLLNNLITNAIKFSHIGGKIVIRAFEENETITIKITDYGLGIDLEKQKIIFDRFTNAKRLGTEGEKSVGLGLSIVKQIVEIHNGNIEVESTPNRGSTFTITLPK